LVYQSKSKRGCWRAAWRQ